MDYNIREMTIGDYEEAYHLWELTEGLCLEEGDSREAIGVYLKRNQGLCFVAYADDRIICTVLCGHEGRRGILRHLAVKRGYRGKGKVKQFTIFDTYGINCRFTIFQKHLVGQYRKASHREPPSYGIGWN